MTTTFIEPSVDTVQEQRDIMASYEYDLAPWPIPFFKRVVFLSGPMRGYAAYNFPAFDRAASFLRLGGWTVLSPAAHDRVTGFDSTKTLDEQPQFDITAAFRWDIESLLQSDAVYFLKDYEASQGAVTEHAIAVSLGLRRMYEVPRDEVKYMYQDHIAYRRN